MLSSREPLALVGCSGTQRTCGTVSGKTAPCLPPLTAKDLQDQWCCLKTHCPLTDGAQGPAVFVMSPPDLLAPCLLLSSDPQVLLCHLRTQCPMPTSAHGPAVPVLSSRDTLSATAKGHAGPVLSSCGPLPHACHCSGSRSTSGYLTGLPTSCRLLMYPQDLWCYVGTPCPTPPAGYSETSRTCAIFSGHPVCQCSGPGLSRRVSMPHACWSSGSSRTNGVISGLPAPVGCTGPPRTCAFFLGFAVCHCSGKSSLPVMSSQDPLLPAECSGTTMTSGVFQGPAASCWVLRDPGPILSSWVPLPPCLASAPDPAGPEVSSQDSLPPVGCSGIHEPVVSSRDSFPTVG